MAGRTRPALPVAPTHLPTPAALMSLSAGEMSSDSTSGRTSRGSGSQSPNLPSASVCTLQLHQCRFRDAAAASASHASVLMATPTFGSTVTLMG
jgi:hypothetical protein